MISRLGKSLSTACFCALAFAIAPLPVKAEALNDFARSLPAEVLQTALLFVDGAPNVRFALLRLADHDRLYFQELSDSGEVSANREIAEVRETGRRLVNLGGEMDSSGLIAFIEIETPDGFGEVFEFYLDGTDYVFQAASN